MAAGGIFTGANPGYTTYELAHHLQICDAKFVVSDLTSLEKAMTAAEQSGIPRCKVFVFDVHGEQIPEGYRSWRQLLQHGEADFVTVVDPEKTTACYINTSGTSGLPKAATLPHSYLVSQAMLQVDRKLPYEVS